MIVPTSPNLYIFHTVNNMDLIATLNNKRKDWTKKYHKIIWKIKTMVDIQLQLQNIVKLAKVANMQLTKIKMMIVQASGVYKTQTARDIFSISKDL